MKGLRPISRNIGGGTIALALLAAAGSLFVVSPASAKYTLVIAIPGLPQGVDLDKHVSPQTWTMAAQLHASGLEWQFGPYPYGTGAFYDPNDLPGYAYPVGYTNQHTEPGIMDSCESSADGKTMTYHIHPGVISAAGNEFTADDVIWRIDRERKRPIIYALISKLFNLDKAKFEKVDKYTVKITNDTPAPLTCPGLTNFYYPWPDAKAIEAQSNKDDPMGDNWIATHGGGFGAYSVTEWTPGKRAVMEANPKFFRGAPKIKKIIWQVVPESSGRLALLEQGKVDIAEELSPDEVLALKDSNVARGVAIRGNRQMWLILNNKTKPFDDPRVRQAINYSIPRDEIVKNVYHGMAKAWSGVISDVTPGYANAKPYDFDPNKAKQLLADAGYADGFETDLVFSAGVPEMENLAVILQSSLAKLNVKLNLKKLPVAAHADTVMSHKSTMALWIDSPIQPDANYVIGLMYSSGPLALVNYSNYSDPQVDKMLEEGAIITDPQKRIDFHKGLQQHLQEGAAFGWSVEPYYRIGLSKKLEGFHWYTTQYYEVYQMSFKD